MASCTKGAWCRGMDGLLVERGAKGFQVVTTFNLKTGEESSNILVYRNERMTRKNPGVDSLVECCPFCGVRMVEIGMHALNYPDVYVKVKSTEEVRDSE